MKLARYLGVALVACGGGGETTPVVHVPAQPSAAPRASAPSAPVAAPAAAPRSPVIASLTRKSGDAHCGLDTDGAVWCWNSMHFEREAPKVRGAKALSAGPTHSCAIDGAGIASCWGKNDAGQLGDGKIVLFRDEVLPVVGLPPVAEILCVWVRTCARTTAGDVLCWGDRSWGKAGDGTLIDEGHTGSSKPSVGTPIVRGATSIATGMDHVCAAFADGSVQCWGGNLRGQAGSTHIHPPLPRPTKVPHAKDVVALAAFEGSTCSIDKVGDVRCWGNLGDASVSPAANFSDAHPSPRRIKLPQPAVEIAVGGSFACARLGDGRVLCWGQNDRSQLGDGTTTDRIDPVPVQLREPALQIALGLDDGCALVRGGRVSCWGAYDRRVPADVAPPEP